MDLTDKVTNYTNQVQAFMIINTFLGSAILQYVFGFLLIDSEKINDNFLLQLSYCFAIVAMFSFLLGVIFSVYALIHFGRITEQKQKQEERQTRMQTEIIMISIFSSYPARLPIAICCCSGVIFSIISIFFILLEKVWFIGCLVYLGSFFLCIIVFCFYLFLTSFNVGFIIRKEKIIDQIIAEIKTVKLTHNKLMSKSSNIGQLVMRLIKETKTVDNELRKNMMLRVKQCRLTDIGDKNFFEDEETEQNEQRYIKIKNLGDSLESKNLSQERKNEIIDNIESLCKTYIEDAKTTFPKKFLK